MSKFEVGDKVIRTIGEWRNVKKGETYIVKDVDSQGSISLLGLSDGYKYDPDYFELVEDTPKCVDLDAPILFKNFYKCMYKNQYIHYQHILHNFQSIKEDNGNYVEIVCNNGYSVILFNEIATNLIKRLDKDLLNVNNTNSNIIE